MDFKNIVGHEDVISHFMSSIERGKVNHAYILSGEKDSGKKTLAYAFAKALLCEEGTGNPCGKCKSCLKAESSNHPDIITVTHESKDQFKIDEIRRQLVDDIATKPYESKYKIYIVPDAELLTKECQNALLKTIEEPPEYGIVMLLTTSIDRMLQTVLSRSLTLTTKPVREKDMLDYLKNDLGLSEDRANFCLDFARGNLGKAIKLAGDDEYKYIVESVVQVLKSINKVGVEDLAFSMEQITKFKVSIDEYLDLMMMWYRDILIYKVTGNYDKMLFKTEFPTLREHAKILSYNAIDEKIQAIERAKRRLKVRAQFEITLELMLLTLKENI